MNAPIIHRRYRAGSKRPLVEVVPDGPLCRIHWPDGEISDLANRTRCCDAARIWAEREIMTGGQNLSVAQRLKSLANFSLASSPVAPNDLAVPTGRKNKNNALTEARP